MVKPADFESLDPDQLYDLGHALGFMFGALVQGFIDGKADFEGAYEEAHAPIADEEEKLERVKTEIADCRTCWCDSCQRIEECELHLEGQLPDGIRPFPCLGCENGMRFRPREKEQCHIYKEGEGLFNNG
ncbi:hypothetical protein UNSWDHB_2631 [Dehalobacter sp. UNSWDHB]|uniref:hypothetical protein n=1 Tax=Dehalobacter sp. UNSWDHB TaxID=1339256 RepID=UPI0003876225|nr:hypothetical protein [Dehalobacter sp. UNSWDHB]EQB20045.1 hypothetical protein UNSWDHB_2631 [Dehalobacter sp. UNSWDHB]